MMIEDDAAYLVQMIEHADKAVRKLGSRTLDELSGDEDLRYVLLHLVQIVGEAARRVSVECQEAHPKIPWRAVIGMRHKIVHDYMEINDRILWEVVAFELQPLIDALRESLPPQASG